VLNNNKLISRWDRRTLRENSNYRRNQAMVKKLCHHYTQFTRNVCLSHRRIV